MSDVSEYFTRSSTHDLNSEYLTQPQQDESDNIPADQTDEHELETNTDGSYDVDHVTMWSLTSHLIHHFGPLVRLAYDGMTSQVREVDEGITGHTCWPGYTADEFAKYSEHGLLMIAVDPIHVWALNTVKMR